MKIFSVLLPLCLLTSIGHAAPAQAPKPNIVLILVDDMGYSDLGAFGGEVRTPNIDSLAKGGLRFTQSYNSARCCPSRAALLTGLYSHQAGIANFTGGDSTAKLGPAYLGKINKQCVTLAEVLRQSGYSTYGVGKWHVGQAENPVDRGFEEYYGFIRGHSASQWKEDVYKRFPEDRKPEIDFTGEEFYATEAFNSYAVEFLKQAEKRDKPFFLYLAHSSPHFPLHAPAKTRDSYLDIYRRGWDALREERYQRQKESGLATEAWKFTERSDVPVDRDDIANGFPGKQNPAWADVPADRREDLAYRMATFAAMVEHVDRGIGKIIAQLKKSGDLDNTLILLTSDNGACYEWGPFGFDGTSRKGKTILHKSEALQQVGGPTSYHSVGSAWSCLSNTPLRMYKHFNHEGGNCSPLIAHWPAGIAKADRWVRTPIHLIDVMPTICAASGAAYPAEFGGNKIIPVEGSSLAPIFAGGESLPERTLCFDHFESSAIRQGDFKLVRGNKRYKNRTWELYNISKDRCETNNLIATQPEKAKELEKIWEDWALRVKVSPYYEHRK
jgi:arylsulfatase A-like enzyme